MRGLLASLVIVTSMGTGPVPSDEVVSWHELTHIPGHVTVELLVVDGSFVAYRLEPSDGAWSPGGDAVLLEGTWWSLLHVPDATDRPNGRDERSLLRRVAGRVASGRMRRVLDVSIGDVTADGRADLVAAFRRPYRRTLINRTRPRRSWVDAHGLSAHVGVYDPRSLAEIWVAGTLVHPVLTVAACDRALAVAYGKTTRRGIREVGAWEWHGFGFLPVEPLAGPGRPRCRDVDRDGRTEPVIERSH